MCEPEPDFQCPECGMALKNTYHCPECDADVRELDGGVDVTEDSLRERLSGESMIHRLREWSDGDTVYAVTQFTEKDRGATGKTFREGGERFENAEERAREFYETGFPPGHVTISVLFRATVKNPRTEPRDPADPGEPPLKFGTFTDVEILDWTDHRGEGDE